MGAIESILTALAQARVRFVVAGGVAVVLQGYPRFTKDLDLVVALDVENALRAARTLKQLGFAPKVAVPIESFAQAVTRRAWMEDKNMRVLGLWSDSFRGTDIDLFLEEPIPFDDLEAAATAFPLAEVAVHVASIDHLIAMKRAAARPQDTIDIEVLELIRRERERAR